MTRPKKVVLEPFEHTLWIFLDFDAAKRWLKRNGCPEDLLAEVGNAQGQVIRYGAPSNGAMQIVLVLDEGWDQETLVHEAGHVAWRLLDYYNVPFDSHNHEILLFMQAGVIRAVNKALRVR